MRITIHITHIRSLHIRSLKVCTQYNLRSLQLTIAWHSVCVRTHSHAHTNTHTHTHTLSLFVSFCLSLSLCLSHTRTHAHTRTQAPTNTHTDNTHSHVNTHTHAHQHHTCRPHHVPAHESWCKQLHEACHTCKWGMSHMWIHHATRINESHRIYMCRKSTSAHESWRTHQRDVAHRPLQHITHTHKSRHTDHCVTSHIQISHSTRIPESRHTSESVTAHFSYSQSAVAWANAQHQHYPSAQHRSHKGLLRCTTKCQKQTCIYGKR